MLSFKSVLASQNVANAELWIWLDQELSAFESHKSNAYLQPLLPHVRILRYDPKEEMAETAFAQSPFVNDVNLPHRSDIFRLVVLAKYGGYFFDPDIVFLRDLADLTHIAGNCEFCYQWSNQGFANSALMHLQQGGKNAIYLLQKALQVGSCFPWNLLQVRDPQLGLTMYPSGFFDPMWLKVDRVDDAPIGIMETFGDFFRPIVLRKCDVACRAVYEQLRGCFAYHWHNHWGAIEAGNSIAGFFNRCIDEALRDKLNMSPHAAFERIVRAV